MKYFAFLALALPLSGCASGNLEADFLCGALTGQPCATLSEIDGTSTLDASTLPEGHADTLNDQLTQDVLFTGKPADGVSGVPAGGAPYQSAQYRIAEKTGRIWLPPYLDSNRILHEGTYVHFVVREASWGTR